MGKPVRKISAKELVADIRSGMDDEALKTRHSLSDKQLQSLLRKLVERNIMSQAELDRRALSSPAIELEMPTDADEPVPTKASRKPSKREKGERTTRRTTSVLVGFVGIVGMIALVLFGLHWFIGWRVEQGLPEGIARQLAEKGSPVQFSFEGVTATPIYRKVRFEKVRAVEKKQNTVFKAEEMDVILSWKDILELARYGELKTVHHVNALTWNSTLANKKRGQKIFAKRADFEIVGPVQNSGGKEFPKEPFAVRIDAKDVRSAGRLPIPGFKEKLGRPAPETASRIQRMGVDFNYNPKPRRLRLQRFWMKAGGLTMNASGVVGIAGPHPGKAEVRDWRLRLNVQVPKEGMKWSSADKSRHYRVGALSIKGNLNYTPDKKAGKDLNPLPHGTFTCLVKGLEIAPSDTKKKGSWVSGVSRMLGGKSGPLSVNKAFFSYKLAKRGDLAVNAELLTSMAEARFNALVDIDNRNVLESNIQTAKLSVKNLNEGFAQMLRLFGGARVEKLLGESNEINVQVTGPLMNPIFKGPSGKQIKKLFKSLKGLSKGEKSEATFDRRPRDR